MATKRINPQRIHRTEADVRKAHVEGQRYGIKATAAIFLNVLLDKYNAEEWIRDYWKDCAKLASEVGEKRVKVDEICAVLIEEYGINIFQGTEDI